MKFEQVLQLVDAVSVSSLTEFKYEEGGVKISMKKAAEGTVDLTAVPSGRPEPAVRIEKEPAVPAAETEVKEAAPAGSSAEEEAGNLSPGRNILCGSRRGLRALCKGRGLGGKRTGAGNRGGHEADERD